MSDKAPKDPGATARRMAAERRACAGIGTAALEGGVVADMRTLLEEIGLEAALADHRPMDASGMVARINRLLDQLEG